MPHDRNRHRPIVVAIAVVLLAIASAGCQSMFPPLVAETDGSGTLTVSVLGSRPTAGSIAMLDITLEQGPVELHQQVPFEDTTSSVEIKNISTGPWRITVKWLDGTGAAMYEGASTAHVHAGKTAHVRVPIDPLPGRLEVTITLGDECTYVSGLSGCLDDLATGGRLHIYPGVKEATDKHNFNWSKGQTEATLATLTLPAGSYDFQVTFYDGNRIDSNRLFEGSWTRFDVLPGGTTQATWHPDIGLLDVGINIQGPPSAPHSLTATMTDKGVRLSWEPPDDTALIYRVYARQGIREHFELQNQDDPTHVPEWLDEENTLCNQEATESFFYVATAVNENGYESLRSNEASVCGSNAG